MNHHRISPARTDTPVPNPAPSRQRLQCGVFSTAASVRFFSLEMRCCRQMTFPEISNLDNFKSSQVIADNLLPPAIPHLPSSIQYPVPSPAPSPARAQRGRQNTTKHDKMRQADRQESDGSHDSVLHDFDLRFPIARLFAP